MGLLSYLTTDLVAGLPENVATIKNALDEIKATVNGNLTQDNLASNAVGITELGFQPVIVHTPAIAQKGSKNIEYVCTPAAGGKCYVFWQVGGRITAGPFPRGVLAQLLLDNALVQTVVGPNQDAVASFTLPPGLYAAGNKAAPFTLEWQDVGGTLFADTESWVTFIVLEVLGE